MRVLAVHAGSVEIRPDTLVDVDSRVEACVRDGAGDEVYSVDGAIVAVVGIEPGDLSGTEVVTTAATADLEELADQVGAETIVLVAVRHGQTGLAVDPEAVLGALHERLSMPSILVPARSYPELVVEATLHPTAVGLRQYDGWLPTANALQKVLDGDHATAEDVSPNETPGEGETGETAPGWATGQESPGETLLDAGLLVDRSDQEPPTWTPAGLFLRDTLLARVRDCALDVSARPTGVRDGSGGPPSCPPNADTGTIQYGVRTLPDGLRPELTVRGTGADLLADRCDDLVTVLRGPLAQLDRSRRTLLAVDEAVDHIPVLDVLDEGLDPGQVVETSALPEPIRLAAIAGIESQDGQEIQPIGALIAARLDDDDWLLQCAPLGRLDRTLGTLLDGPRPILPPSIAPTQIRLLPIGDAQLEGCERIADSLAGDGVRVDIDDRTLPVGERISTARRNGVPYYAVVGPQETDSETLPMTDRRSADEHTLSPTEITTEYPPLAGATHRRRYGPRFVSERCTDQHCDH
jgi:hypothetical protein